MHVHMHAHVAKIETKSTIERFICIRAQIRIQNNTIIGFTYSQFKTLHVTDITVARVVLLMIKRDCPPALSTALEAPRTMAVAA